MSQPADPVYGGSYTLLDVTGLQQHIDAKTGQLLSMEDRKGNRLTFTDDGIESNRGVAVAFERDPRGRISAVVDPRGNKVRYGYDARGDLVAVTDRLGNTTGYVYRTDAAAAHYLDRIDDPLGRPVVRTAYDDGSTSPADRNRLTSVTDAAGQAVQLGYDLSDPAAAKQTILDPVNAGLPGQPKTTLTYDVRGNVTESVDPSGLVTQATFGNSEARLRDLPTAVAQVIGAAGGTDDLVTELAYDGDGNVVALTDPAGKTSRLTYSIHRLPN